jgi:hypothetical protein
MPNLIISQIKDSTIEAPPGLNPIFSLPITENLAWFVASQNFSSIKSFEPFIEIPS